MKSPPAGDAILPDGAVLCESLLEQIGGHCQVEA
jgi:hypothetical protein